MMLKEKLEDKIPAWRERVGKLLKESRGAKVSEVTSGQIYGGMRGVQGLVTDISHVDPSEGVRLRGYTIPEILKILPKAEGTKIPLVGGLYYLLLIGDVPTLEDALEVEKEWQARSEVPSHVFEVLKFLANDATPMNLFSSAILSLESTSQFTKQYNQGIRREDYWKPMLEDSLNLTAKLPTIAAYIYGLKQGDGTIPQFDRNFDWSGNFAHIVGVENIDYQDLSRLYFIIHSDHESGNVSAHTAHLVGSTLSNIYYAASAGMHGLAGPLHGRASQENLRWLMQVLEEHGSVPTKEELKQYTRDMLISRRVIPGYGHAVLRKTDPRYTALYEFGKQNIKDDPLFDLACLMYEVVPDVLKEHGKAKNPWPNVDAISGTMQHHYGVKDCVHFTGCGFYTVLFGVSRILGVTANAIWARALGQPIERPRSLTTAMLEEIAYKV